ncbi:hypothetical protein ABG79_00186 [Caloramator mitchellensis]|uniref:GrdX protein n=1 Tax=Caloramator mitchellensis TaxID=908809 RepID=A0A0R3K3M3_CALMK|nr:GrdX family protein [Caloramator mitchellensis]KRQ88020.1 hypothetical protein ABG79_00186 [Caloramator mitchellensis]
MEKVIIVTNNVITMEKMSDKHDIIWVDGSLLDVLYKVRDYIHRNHKLLTHPLMGSIKPNQTPYKSVAISKNPLETLDFESLSFIENSIETAQSLIKSKPHRTYPDSVYDDFRIIDYDLIFNALNR